MSEKQQGVLFEGVPWTTPHYSRVRKMMKLFGQDTPECPTEPDEKTRLLRARLILEEVLETIQKGLGVQITIHNLPDAYSDGALVFFDDLEFEIDGEYNAVETADGCADISVVTMGTLVACGIPDEELLELVDANNLEKVENGTVDEHGKFQKHPDHQPPDIARWLESIRCPICRSMEE